MKFRYKKYAPGILRPVIPIEIIHKDKTVSYEVLIDSGADCNIFDAQIADILEIKLSSGKRSAVAGITGVSKPFYLHKLNLKVGGYLIKNVEVGFLRQMGEYSYGIVGQTGFFDIFIVKFDLTKEEIELKERKWWRKSKNSPKKEAFPKDLAMGSFFFSFLLHLFRVF